MNRVLPLAAVVLALALPSRASPTTPPTAPVPSPADDGLERPAMADAFVLEVTPRLDVPASEAAAYGARLQAALDTQGVLAAKLQFVALVDRDPLVQAVLIFLGSRGHGWVLVGATPASTGLPGRFEHFATPLGVFEHSLAHPDYRAEGTQNDLGIRGYGRKGARVYDFGWVHAAKGWGDGARSVMRLQMHATDPDVLEARLGSAQSKGCVRIPATLNTFIDRHGLLDAAYEEALATGARLWVLRPDRTPSGTPGRYLVVVDSQRSERPAWSPPPVRR